MTAPALVPLLRERPDDAAAAALASLEARLAAVRCGTCCHVVPEPGLFVVVRPTGPVDVCDADCGRVLDDESRHPEPESLQRIVPTRGATP